MFALSLLLSAHTPAIAAMPLRSGPQELLQISTPADTDASSEVELDFIFHRGALIVVGTTDGSGVAGRCNLSVSGAISQPLLLGTAGYVYHSASTTHRPSSELVIAADPLWGRAILTLSYDASMGSAASADTVECAVYQETNLTLRPGMESVLTLDVAPTELSCDSVDTAIPYDGWLVLENQSDSGAYGGGGIQLYLDGAGVLEFGVGDEPSGRPSTMAYPVEAAANLTVELCHEDDTTGDNIGDRAVEVTFRRALR